MVRLLTPIYSDTPQEHHPAAPHACEPPSDRCHQGVPRPPQRRPRKRFLPRSTRPHSQNPYLRCWAIPINLPIAHPRSLSFECKCLRVHALPFPLICVLSAVGVFAPVVFLPRAFVVFTAAFFNAGFFFANFFFGVPLFLASFLLTVLFIGFLFFPADPFGFVNIWT